MQHDDDDLWAHITRDVDPLQREEKIVEEEPKARQLPSERKRSETPSIQQSAPVLQEKQPVGASSELDRKTAERLRKGQIPIEARIDLHGHRQAEARPMLESFMHQSVQRGMRCVLVITGKGSADGRMRDPLDSGSGVLKQNVPLWLEDPSMRNIVLKAVEARPKDGGSGALYVYLRRKR